MSGAEVVRVAASRRSFLIGLWPIAAYYVIYFPVALLWPGDAPQPSFPGWTAVFPIAGCLTYWLFNRRAAIWIERSAEGVTVRPR